VLSDPSASRLLVFQKNDRARWFYERHGLPARHAQQRLGSMEHEPVGRRYTSSSSFDAPRHGFPARPRNPGVTLGYLPTPLRAANMAVDGGCAACRAGASVLRGSSLSPSLPLMRGPSGQTEWAELCRASLASIPLMGPWLLEAASPESRTTRVATSRIRTSQFVGKATERAQVGCAGKGPRVWIGAKSIEPAPPGLLDDRDGGTGVRLPPALERGLQFGSVVAVADAV